MHAENRARRDRQPLADLGQAVLRREVGEGGLAGDLAVARGTDLIAGHGDQIGRRRAQRRLRSRYAVERVEVLALDGDDLQARRRRRLRTLVAVDPDVLHRRLEHGRIDQAGRRRKVAGRQRLDAGAAGHRRRGGGHRVRRVDADQHLLRHLQAGRGVLVRGSRNERRVGGGRRIGLGGRDGDRRRALQRVVADAHRDLAVAGGHAAGGRAERLPGRRRVAAPAAPAAAGEAGHDGGKGQGPDCELDCRCAHGDVPLGAFSMHCYCASRSVPLVIR